MDVDLSLRADLKHSSGRAIRKSDKRSGKIHLRPRNKVLLAGGARCPCPTLGQAKLAEIRSFA